MKRGIPFNIAPAIEIIAMENATVVNDFSAPGIDTGPGQSYGTTHLIDTEGFIEKDKEMIKKMGEQSGHAEDWEEYKNETPYVRRRLVRGKVVDVPIVAVVDAMEHLCNEVSSGELTTFVWKFKQAYPDGFFYNEDPLTPDVLTYQGIEPPQLAKIFSAYFKETGPFTQQARANTPRAEFNFTDEINPLDIDSMSTLRDNVKKALTSAWNANNGYGNKLDIQHKRMVNKVTKSRNAAKAARKARKKK